MCAVSGALFSLYPPTRRRSQRVQKEGMASPPPPTTVTSVCHALAPYLGRGLSGVMGLQGPPLVRSDGGAAHPGGASGASSGVRIALPVGLAGGRSAPAGGGGASALTPAALRVVAMGGWVSVGAEPFVAAVLALPLPRIVGSDASRGGGDGHAPSPALLRALLALGAASGEPLDASPDERLRRRRTRRLFGRLEVRGYKRQKGVVGDAEIGAECAAHEVVLRCPQSIQRTKLS